MSHLTQISEADARHRFNVSIDQNCKKFDLSIPLQAFHFFISIHRIFKQQELLAEKLRKRSTKLAEIWKDPQNELHKWMMKPKVKVSKKATSRSDTK
jgi:hypothetical protein